MRTEVKIHLILTEQEKDQLQKAKNLIYDIRENLRPYEIEENALFSKVNTIYYYLLDLQDAVEEDD